MVQSAPTRQIVRRGATFSLRAMMLTVALVGAWLAWERSVVTQREALRQELAAAGAALMTFGVEPHQMPQPPFVRRLMGDVLITDILIPADFAPDLLSRAQRCFPEADIRSIRSQQIMVMPSDEPDEWQRGRIQALELQGFGR